MSIKDKIIEKLNKIVKIDQILTDSEDLYVYSFEQVFLNQNKVKPDIVIRVCNKIDENKIKDFVQEEDLILLERGKNNLIDIGKSPRPLILFDNVEIPNLENCSKAETNNRLNNNHIEKYGTYKNIALAVQNLFLGKNISKCQQCTTCSGYCTVSKSFKGIETWSSKGRFLITRGIMKGDLAFSEKVVDILYNCTKCGLCFAQCFQNLEFHEAILYLRHKLVKENLTPEIFHTTSENIIKYGDPSGTPTDRRLSRVHNYSKSNLSKQSEILCWLGCTVATRAPKTAQSLINILNRMKVDYTMLGNNEGCCGYVLISSGLWEDAKIVAEAVIKRIERTKANTLITPCSGCYYTFTRLYPEILNVRLPCKILHTSQFLDKTIQNKKVKLKPLEINVTYHDPCSLGRHSHIYEPPRNVLKAIPKLNLIEMPLNRNCARCCGGGGGLWSFNNKVSLESTQRRLKEDLPKNVNVLTTACPQCKINFRFASHAKKSINRSLKIYDITELFESAMQIE
ncbi:MAG: (Fe-S)-binding protein [Promethearchaeota archaeon]